MAKAVERARVQRCAIYTRKSSEEGLEQEFNSLHAQRESGEAYVASMKHEGWVCLPDQYDDGGYTGGNLERPAVAQLLADIEAGKVDVVVVYKVDRLSRSLLDFARMMEVFEKHKVSFVSVTQQFNTTHSMGRLTLNILLSFAQFEREIISERTRDKIAAARKKGLWSGGRPVLGYDLSKGKLKVNEREAAQVREIFAMYLKHRSLSQTVEELARRGWTTKKWTTAKGAEMGGAPFSKARLHLLLHNVAYIGRVRHNADVYPGEHEAIVDPEIWAKAQEVLRINGQSGSSEVRNKYGSLLKGLLCCGPCEKPMGHTYATKPDGTCYRYYVCHTAQSRGYHACPSKSLPAEEIERFVVERIKSVAEDRGLASLLLDESRRQEQSRITELNVELRAIEREMARLETETRRTVKTSGPLVADRLAELQDLTTKNSERASAIQRELREAEGALVNREEVESSLRQFTPLWDHLSPKEQASFLRLLISKVEYDGKRGQVAITFHPEASAIAVSGKQGAMA